MIFAYMEIVVRDRASDRGCTGGSEGVANIGPPGVILGGFSFARSPVCQVPRLPSPPFAKSPVCQVARPTCPRQRLSALE